MTNPVLDERDKERIRDGLQRELACLQALGMAPEQFEAARHARSLRRRRPEPVREPAGFDCPLAAAGR